MTVQNWLLGGGLGIMIAILGIILRVSYKIGGDAEKFGTGLLRLGKVEDRIEKFAEHEVKIGQLAAYQERLHSEFKGLKTSVEDNVKELRDDIKQIHRGSRPNINGE